MNETVVGHAHCGTDGYDLTAQGHALAGLGLPEDRAYLDGAYAGIYRHRPKLGEPLAAAGNGDTFAVASLGAVAEAGANLTKMRTREGTAIAKPTGTLKGRWPILTTSRQARLTKLHAADERSISEPAEVFSRSRPRAYRVSARNGTS